MQQQFRGSMEPNVKDKTQPVKKLPEKLKEFIVDLRSKSAADDSARANWKTKMITANNQRLGVKRATNKPYVGAPDIPLPETDKIIKKAVPTLILSSWAPKKKCVVSIEQGVQDTPDMVTKAKRAEAGMNMVLTHPKTDMFRKLCLSADFAKQYGHCIFRIFEDFRSRIVHKVINLDTYNDNIVQELRSASKQELTDFLVERYKFDIEDEDDIETIADIISQIKDKETIIEFDTKEIYSYPNFSVPVPTKVTVPPFTTDINRASRITFEYFLTKEELEEKMEDGIFDKKDLEEIVKRNQTSIGVDSLEETKSRNEGVEDNASDKELFRIHEICCWYKPEGGKRHEKYVFTFLADINSPEDSTLQKIQFPYEFDGWHYEKYDDEVKDPRYHASRGIPERIRAYQEIMERNINNMLIRDEMNNTPMWEVLDNSEIMDTSIRFVPGEKVPVKVLGGEIKRLNEPIQVDISSERIMQIIKAHTEEYVGSTDQLFRNASNKGGGKTLGEIQEGIRQSSGTATLDVIHWNEVLSRVYTKMFYIMRERLGQSLYIKEGDTIMEVTSEDFNFPAEVRSNGNLEVSDKELATSKAFARISVLTQNPIFTQIMDAEDVYNLASDWLEKDGVKDPEQFITSPEKLLQSRIAQATQQLQQLQMAIQQSGQEKMQIDKASGKVKMKIGQDIAKFQGEKEAIDEQPVSRTA